MSKNIRSRGLHSAMLRQQPQDARALSGTFDQTVMLHQSPHRATSSKPQKKAQSVSGVFAQALSLHQRGLVADAQALWREILQKVPGHFEALLLLGMSEYDNGRYEEADRLLLRAISVDPRSAKAHCHRGVVLHALSRFEEAVASYDKAIAISPGESELHSNRGNALQGLGRFDEAVASYEAALAIKPDNAAALGNHACALTELRRFDEAVASCDKAIALSPDNAPALNNRGNALMHLRRYEEALASYDKALAIKPDFPAAWLGRGSILLGGRWFAEAFAAFNQALAIDPAYFKALLQLASYYESQSDIKGVMSCYDRALAIRPDYADGISNKIFSLDSVPNVGFEEQQEARKQWWQHVGAKIAAKSQLNHSNSLDPTRRIILGYVSSDFRAHSASLAFGPVLKNHDKARFETVCYSCHVVDDSVTKEFQQASDRWRNTSQLSDDLLADQIRADKIDILIDLSGHTAGNRLGVFARKPAPIQVTAWGNATGTGLQTIDYLFSDPVAIPHAVRHLFAEKIYDLPCLIMMGAPPAALRPSDPPVLLKQHVTFGVFNRISKISDDAVMVWAEILRSEPRSRLLIKHFNLEEESVRSVLRERFAKHGIADRVDFLGATSREEHLAAYGNVDICLDPFPQNGGVSTWEPLYMGVPVVAKLGNTVPSRLGSAILSSVGLDEWVADSSDEYMAIALKYASQPDYLKKLRHELPTKISMSVAGNAARYTRAVEEAYRAMWEDYCKRKS